jgi:signal transduction histidine kinase
MRKSGYQSIFHIYFIFLIVFLGITAVGSGIFINIATIHKPDGSIERSDWPRRFTEEFSDQIIFIDDKPQVKQTGLEKLQENQLWIQIIDQDGRETYRYLKPDHIPMHYSAKDILEINRTGRMGNTSAYLNSIQYKQSEWIYIICFPIKINQITAYVNGSIFNNGKTIGMVLAVTILLTGIVSGIGYGYWITRKLSGITAAVDDVTKRRYLPVKDPGTFEEVYHSLNALDSEIRESDKLREQTEKMQKEWIANITHDLKTPLSPIKGYAELLADAKEGIPSAEIERYAKIMLKNIAYASTLIDDLKLTYQLENGIVPMQVTTYNLVRFIKELIIDILNSSAYEERLIHFQCNKDNISMSFDATLLTRAFHNLILNAFIHGDENTEVNLSINIIKDKIQIIIRDNGKGMNREEVNKLFIRYYRGTNTGQKAEGTGLGLAIAKQIIELHKGIITADSNPGVGTSFQILFPVSIDTSSLD